MLDDGLPGSHPPSSTESQFLHLLLVLALAISHTRTLKRYHIVIDDKPAAVDNWLSDYLDFYVPILKRGLDHRFIDWFLMPQAGAITERLNTRS